MNDKPRFRPTAQVGFWANVVEDGIRRRLTGDPYASFAREQRLAANARRIAELNLAPRSSAPNPVASAEPMVNVFSRYQGSQSKADSFGFASIGEYALAVKKASNPEPGAEARAMHARLQNAALSTYGSEGVGADGGFAVPPEFRNKVLQKIMGAGEIFGMCDIVSTEAAAVTVPKDESAPWSTTGIRGYWESEAKTMPQSKPALETSTIKLNKIMSFVPMSDELLEDAPALSDWLPRKAAEVIAFRLGDAILNGTGAGMPLGILNAAHTVQQSKESSQVAATIHGLNLVKMWSRMPAGWRRNAVWLVHPDAEPELARAGLQIKSADGVTNVGGSLVYMQPGSIADQPYATLFGRPVIPTQSCQALGTAGDLIFADLAQYAAFVRSPGLKTETSIHLWFDQGVTAFRFVFRVGGQPWWSSPISPKNGSTTQSAFVKLESR